MRGKVMVVVQFACLLALVLAPGSGAVASERVLAARMLTGVAGVVLALAFVTLRSSVTVFPEPREGVPFITQGIYSYVRHPMYLGVLLFGAAMVCVKWTWLTLAIWLVLLADLQLKYRYEDRLLAAKWPQAALYQATVGALLPRRWKGTAQSG